MNDKRKIAFLLSLILGVIIFAYLKDIGYKSIKPNNGSYKSYRYGNYETYVDGKRRRPYGTVSSSEYANEIGIEILANGGNAIDAFVASAYGLGAFEPFGSGVGGGGITLYYDAKSEKCYYIDYREVAPVKKNMYNIAIPGFVKGMEYLSNQFGTIPLEQLIGKTIKKCKEEFVVNDYFRIRMNKTPYSLKRPLQKVLNSYRYIYEYIDLLESLMAEGSEWYYSNENLIKLNKITDEVIFEEEEFTNYSIRSFELTPLEFENMSVFTPPPPSVGILYIQSYLLSNKLGINIDNYRGKLDKMMSLYNIMQKEKYKHIYDDNSGIDNSTILESGYLEDLIEFDKGLLLDRALSDIEGTSTSHIVVIDMYGNLVSSTNSLGNFFGAGVYVDGYFLNNHLKNFSKNDRSKNNYESGKRPRSYIAPMIMERGGQRIGFGTPGGEGIYSTLMQFFFYLDRYDEYGDFNELPRISIINNQILFEKLNSISSKNVVDYYDLNKSMFGNLNYLLLDRNSNTIEGESDFRRSSHSLIIN